jgi:entericidin B
MLTGENSMPFLKRPSTRRAAAVIALLLGTSVAACNTIEGAGQDMQSGGKAIERKADDAKN